MTPYARGNKFSPYLSVADAAVDWAGLTPADYPFIFLNDAGLPVHLDNRELRERAEALLTHIYHRGITGYTHNEDGGLLPTKRIKLDRESYKKWLTVQNCI